LFDVGATVKSLGDKNKVTKPRSLKTQGVLVEQGSGDITATSDESVPANACGLFPGAASSLSTVKKTGEWPCRTTSPHEVNRETTAATVRSFRTARRECIIFSLSLDDARRDEYE
jgi:hypothetical protein